MADKLRDEIREIQNMRQAQENELAAIENAALKQRFQVALAKLEAQEQEKKEEVVYCDFVFIFPILLIKFYSSMTKSFLCYDESEWHRWRNTETVHSSKSCRLMVPSLAKILDGIRTLPVCTPSIMERRILLS